MLGLSDTVERGRPTRFERDAIENLSLNEEPAMMIRTAAVSRATAVSTGDATRQRSAGGSHRLRREEWVSNCAVRLSQLRLSEDPEFIASVAARMWADVASFDPVIAAEMEHEAWPWDH